MKEELSHQVLKDLVFKFKETKDQSAFCKILKRIDDLIVYTVNKFVAKRPQFCNIDLQDLYDLSILGLYKGIESATESEPGIKLQARLIAYMKSEMLSFCNSSVERSDRLCKLIVKDTVVPEETVYHDLEVEFLRERYQKLIDDDVIDSTDWNLLNMRFVDSMKIKDIARALQCHEDTVRRRIKDSLNRIRWELRRRNLEDI